jgi:hypothetical protein
VTVTLIRTDVAVFAGSDLLDVYHRAPARRERDQGFARRKFPERWMSRFDSDEVETDTSILNCIESFPQSFSRCTQVYLQLQSWNLRTVIPWNLRIATSSREENFAKHPLLKIQSDLHESLQNAG